MPRPTQTLDEKLSAIHPDLNRDAIDAALETLSRHHFFAMHNVNGCLEKVIDKIGEGGAGQTLANPDLTLRGMKNLNILLFPLNSLILLAEFKTISNKPVCLFEAEDYGRLRGITNDDFEALAQAAAVLAIATVLRDKAAAPASQAKPVAAVSPALGELSRHRYVWPIGLSGT